LWMFWSSIKAWKSDPVPEASTVMRNPDTY
jgi:hypothetical protein